MAATQPAVPPGKVRASAAAARFSEDISATHRRSPRPSRAPTGRREAVCLTPSTSARSISIVSSSGSRASSTTMAVMSLVMEAIGAT